MAKKSRRTVQQDTPPPKKRGWQQIEEPGMPKVVSDRMLRRMAVFCGTPTALGLAAFPTSYLLLQQGIKIPVPVVVVVTLGLFGLGMVGLSYGILSASWDADRVGHWLGWQEFRTNWGRLRAGLASIKAKRNNSAA
ncbi:MAG: PAM68 family protein [Gloeomargarita sp. SKYBB_i_bin120]|nr:PAM68 family protein [Gloeomargarita sp. SKYG98]MCS7292174.1 PAM68 family protein [Gloeomargarita sp. SKYB120]MDW8177735.1 PAM68 family protein [Gloeomargarita sp. SKYBB_i_bin120]